MLPLKNRELFSPCSCGELEDGYELVAGERRLRAAKLAGYQEVPCVRKEVTEKQLLEMSLVENIQRENLNPMEEADAYHRLITVFELTQEEVAMRVGKSRPAVANFLRLRQLPEQIKESIIDGALSMGHARALLGIPNTAQQSAVWRRWSQKDCPCGRQNLLSTASRENPVRQKNASRGLTRYISQIFLRSFRVTLEPRYRFDDGVRREKLK